MPVQVLAVEVFVGENGPSEARVYHDPKIWIHSGDPHFLRDVKQLLKAGGFPCRVEYDRHKVVKRGYTNFVLAPPA